MLARFQLNDAAFVEASNLNAAASGTGLHSRRYQNATTRKKDRPLYALVNASLPGAPHFGGHYMNPNLANASAAVMPF